MAIRSIIQQSAFSNRVNRRGTINPSFGAGQTDAYYNLTTLLLPGDGTNGAQNNTFLDSSSNNFTITRNGNTTQGTFSPFSQTGWSNLFGGTTFAITTPSNAALALDTGSFTVEAYIYVTSLGAQNVIASSRASAGTSTLYWLFSVATTGQLEFQSRTSGGTQYFARSSTGAITSNQWYHVAATRTSGGLITVYVQGVAGSTTVNDISNNLSESTVGVGLFNFTGSILSFSGYISNFRIVKGAVVYTSGFTPPTSALSIYGSGTTSLLTCQSNRFIDNGNGNSGSGFTLTAGSNSNVQAFSPFAPTAAYNAATVGGSGYFDGTGDFLTAGSNSAYNIDFGSTDSFICEGWFYWNAVQASVSLVDNGGSDGVSFSNWQIVLNESSQIQIAWGNSAGAGNPIGTLSTSIVPNSGSWFHIALVKTNVDWACFINGVRRTNFNGLNTATKSSGSQLRIADGITSQVSGVRFNGYISGLRIYKGANAEAPYSATSTTITVPTAPPTPITNTNLLLNFTNAGITDATAKNVLETVGNAQISTTQSKFGGSSMYFDGNGDYLSIPSGPNLNLSSGDWTIEAWIYQTINTAGAVIVQKDAVSGSSYPSWAIGCDSSGKFRLIVGSGNGTSYIQSVVATSFSNTTNVWYHIAAVKSGTTLTLYIDGVSRASATQTGTIVDGGKAVLVGYESGQPTASYWNGYIDDLRITKGYARYTSNFTPPTRAFATL